MSELCSFNEKIHYVFYLFIVSHKKLLSSLNDVLCWMLRNFIHGWNTTAEAWVPVHSGQLLSGVLAAFLLKIKAKKPKNNNNNKNGKQITPYITNEQCIALFTGKAMCCSVWSHARHRIWCIAVSTFICKRKSNMPEWVCVCLQWFFSLLLFPLLKTVNASKQVYCKSAANFTVHCSIVYNK